MLEQTIDAFDQELTRAGFQEILTKHFAHGYRAEPHTHSFDVSVLVTTGRFVLTRDGETRAYETGQRFEFPAGQLHAEGVGPDGATLRLGRRHGTNP